MSGVAVHDAIVSKFEVDVGDIGCEYTAFDEACEDMAYVCEGVVLAQIFFEAADSFGLLKLYAGSGAP